MTSTQLTLHGNGADVAPRRPDPGLVGTVHCPPTRPATPHEVWVELLPSADVALHDLLLIPGTTQHLLGSVADLERIDPDTAAPPPHPGLHRSAPPHGRSSQRTFARLSIVGSSVPAWRPPDGARVRRPTPEEVTALLGAAAAIPPAAQVPMGVVPLATGMAPIYCHRDRLVGPLATSLVISGAAGSLKSTAGMLTTLALLQATQGEMAAVIINSKGSDFVFAEYAREHWADQGVVPPLRPADRAMYAALGWATPPTLPTPTVWVPDSTDLSWRSLRPSTFPRTRAYQLSHTAGLRYALSPTDDDERPASIITRQCIEEVAGAFATEHGLTTVMEMAAALEHEVLTLSSERARWRNQFQGTTVVAALRQLQATVRDLGPLLGQSTQPWAFPVADLAAGGVWVIDVAPLPQRAAQAVIDEVVQVLWQAKATGVIPSALPLVLVIDELNRWNPAGPTARRLASIVRDQRHRRFGLIGLAQQLSTLQPQLLANADTFWYGLTRAQEAVADCYAHLPPHLRMGLHRLPPGQRVLEAWPLAAPLQVAIPYPSWLISDEGLAVVAAWERAGRPSHWPGAVQ